MACTMLSSFTLQMPMKVARRATVIATHVFKRACAGVAGASRGSACWIGSISMAPKVPDTRSPANEDFLSGGPSGTRIAVDATHVERFAERPDGRDAADHREHGA